VGGVFDATFHVTDDWDNTTTSAAGQVSLTVGSAGTFTPSGPSSASAPGSAGTVSGAYNTAGTAIPITAHLFDPVITALEIAHSNSINADFAATGVGSITALPGVSASLQSTNFSGSGGAPSCAPGVTACASGSLPQGADGLVTLNLESCGTAGLTAGGVCNSTTQTDPVVAHITATLKKKDPVTGALTNLYDALHPASLVYVCDAAKCKWNYEADDLQTKVYNNWEESVEAYNNNPLYAEDASNPGVIYRIPSCQTLPTNEDDNHSQPAATTVAGGQRSCIDIANTMWNTTSGDLSFKILWYDDYKVIPGS
jgi:hypothetical protein